MEVRGVEYGVGASVRRGGREEGVGGRGGRQWALVAVEVHGDGQSASHGSVQPGGGREGGVRVQAAAPSVGATSLGANAFSTERSSELSSVPDPARERTRGRSVLPWSGHASAPRVRALWASNTIREGFTPHRLCRTC